MDNYIIEPFLARCDDRTILAQENPVIGNPDEWFSNSNLHSFGLAGINFEFFIEWLMHTEIPLLDQNIWLKRPINPDVVTLSQISDEEILQILRKDRFFELARFARRNNLTASAILFDDGVDWANSASELIRAYWPKDESRRKGLRIERINRSTLENIIREKSGGPIEMGDKGLIFGTSRLECYLAKHTDALWPGDVDLVLYNREDFTPLVILEFKKHTARASYKFSENSLAKRNYVGPGGDARKYDRLTLLSSQLSHGKQLPFFIVFYSTEHHEHNLIIEPVIGTYKNISGGEKTVFRLDPDNMAHSTNHLIQTILTLAGLTK